MPPGEAGDRTRRPAIYDAIADFLVACGARKLEQAHALVDSVNAETLLV